MATSKLFFEDLNNEIVRSNLFSDVAKNEVEKFLIFNEKNGKKRAAKGTPTSTQIRKFFNDIIAIKNKIDTATTEEDKLKKFKKELPYIKMIKAKVAYAKSRDKVNDEFESFINRYLNEIKDLKDFYVFCDFFEAIIAYSKLLYK